MFFTTGMFFIGIFALVWVMVALPLIILFLIATLIQNVQRKNFNLKNQHVMITGGSSGIGKSIAAEAIKKGASVSLLARNVAKLDEAKKEIEKLIIDRSQQQIRCYSVDLSEDFSAVEAVIEQAENEIQPVDILINCAGTSVSGRFEELDIGAFKKMMDINYMSAVHATRAVIASMKQRRKGRIVFTSSLAGLAGFYGFTSYSASKFALKGLAESLQMEVKSYNISVTVSYPPDTDTPGFAEEQKSKPLESKLISESGGLCSSDDVGTKILEDCVFGDFQSAMGIEGFMLSTLSAGMSPVSSLSSLLGQVLFMGTFRLISCFYLANFDKIIKKCMHVKDQNKKSD